MKTQLTDTKIYGPGGGEVKRVVKDRPMGLKSIVGVNFWCRVAVEVGMKTASKKAPKKDIQTKQTFIIYEGNGEVLVTTPEARNTFIWDFFGYLSNPSPNDRSIDDYDVRVVKDSGLCLSSGIKID
jgi:hypothetical protein